MPFPKLLNAMLWAGAVAAIASCSKTTVQLDQPAPEQNPPHQQNVAERIAEIDKLLAAPLTGRPEDSDRRVVLRAERNALTGNRQVAFSQSSIATQQQRIQSEATQHQLMIDKLKADAERSKFAEQRQLQAQRDQWDKEDRLSLRKMNGDFRPEAPAQNVYDIQISNDRRRRNHPDYSR